MGNVAVVGAQWGDEGKGKIVDWLSERADVVVRFQGGANAGHTLVVGNVEYKLSLLPSGVVRPGKLSIIGNGVVVDPWALIAEIDVMRKKGLTISPETLRLADNAALILPSPGAPERARGEGRGEKRHGRPGSRPPPQKFTHMPRGSGDCSPPPAAPAAAFCSRGRRARCSMSTTAPIPTSPRPTQWPGKPRPDRGSRPR